MKITILCSDCEHPVNQWLECWMTMRSGSHQIAICRDKSQLVGGDILFLVSCSQIIDAKTRSKYRYTLVLHASDLPKGRGWSPHIWAVLEGAEIVTVSLLQAEDGVDTGPIWAKRNFPVPKHALHDEIHKELFDTEIALMDEALTLVESGVQPVDQKKDGSKSYYPKRSPSDSEVDPMLPLADLFNTIRIMDPQRYPAFFRLHGHKYTIEIKKVE